MVKNLNKGLLCLQIQLVVRGRLEPRESGLQVHTSNHLTSGLQIVLLCTSLVFLKVPACLCNSIMNLACFLFLYYCSHMPLPAVRNLEEELHVP